MHLTRRKFGIGKSGFAHEPACKGIEEFINLKLVTSAALGTPPLGA